MTKIKNEYHRYFKDLSKYSDALDVYKATSTTRMGIRRARDFFIIGRNYYGEGSYYVGIARDFIYLLALIPLALVQLGINQSYALAFAVTYLGLCLLVGYSSYRWFSFARAEKEYDDKMSVSRYMTWALLKEILENQQREQAQKKKRRTKK